MKLSKRVHPHYWRIKLFLKRISGQDLWIRSDVVLETHACGPWTYYKNHLGSDSIMYSLGVGDEVRFDLEIIEVCGLTIYAFDPTPTSMEWITSQELPGQFVFHQWAVSGNDGVLRMAQRVNARGKKSAGMWTSVLESSNDAETIEVPCYSLPTIMDKLNHERIDLLKMDVEGSEYEIIESMLAMPHRPSQLLVEFHHRFPGIGMEKTAECINNLRTAGYKIFTVSVTGREVGFIHESILSKEGRADDVT